MYLFQAARVFGLPDFSLDGAPQIDARLQLRVRLCGHKASVMSMCLPEPPSATFAHPEGMLMWLAV